MSLGAVSVPLPGLQFELVVTYAVDVAVGVGRGGRRSRVEVRGISPTRGGDNVLHYLPPVNGFQHSPRVVFVVHHLPIGIGDVLHTVPTVVTVLHPEGILMVLVWEHKSMIIFDNFAHPAIFKCLEAGSVLQQGDSATAVVGCRAVSVGVAHIVLVHELTTFPFSFHAAKVQQ